MSGHYSDMRLDVCGRRGMISGSSVLATRRASSVVYSVLGFDPQPVELVYKRHRGSNQLKSAHLNHKTTDQKVLSSNLGGRKSSPRGKRLAILTSKTGKNSRDTAGILPLKF